MLRAWAQGVSVFWVSEHIVKVWKKSKRSKIGQKKDRENLLTRFSTISYSRKKVTWKRRLEKSESLIYRSYLKQTSSRSNSCIVGVSVEEVFELKIGQKFFSGVFSDKKISKQPHGRDSPYDDDFIYIQKFWPILWEAELKVEPVRDLREFLFGKGARILRE